MSRKKIVITGTAGLLGPHDAEQLLGWKSEHCWRDYVS